MTSEALYLCVICSKMFCNSARHDPSHAKDHFSSDTRHFAFLTTEKYLFCSKCQAFLDFQALDTMGQRTYKKIIKVFELPPATPQERIQPRATFNYSSLLIASISPSPIKERATVQVMDPYYLHNQPSEAITNVVKEAAKVRATVNEGNLEKNSFSNKTLPRGTELKSPRDEEIKEEEMGDISTSQAIGKNEKDETGTPKNDTNFMQRVGSDWKEEAAVLSPGINEFEEAKEGRTAFKEFSNEKKEIAAKSLIREVLPKKPMNYAVTSTALDQFGHVGHFIPHRNAHGNSHNRPRRWVPLKISTQEMNAEDSREIESDSEINRGDISAYYPRATRFEDFNKEEPQYENNEDMNYDQQAELQASSKNSATTGILQANSQLSYQKTANISPGDIAKTTIYPNAKKMRTPPLDLSKLKRGQQPGTEEEKHKANDVPQAIHYPTDSSMQLTNIDEANTNIKSFDVHQESIKPDPQYLLHIGEEKLIYPGSNLAYSAALRQTQHSENKKEELNKAAHLHHSKAEEGKCSQNVSIITTKERSIPEAEKQPLSKKNNKETNNLKPSLKINEKPKSMEEESKKFANDNNLGGANKSQSPREMNQEEKPSSAEISKEYINRREGAKKLKSDTKTNLNEEDKLSAELNKPTLSNNIEEKCKTEGMQKEEKLLSETSLASLGANKKGGAIMPEKEIKIDKEKKPSAEPGISNYSENSTEKTSILQAPIKLNEEGNSFARPSEPCINDGKTDEEENLKEIEKSNNEKKKFENDKKAMVIGSNIEETNEVLNNKPKNETSKEGRNNMPNNKKMNEEQMLPGGSSKQFESGTSIKREDKPQRIVKLKDEKDGKFSEEIASGTDSNKKSSEKENILQSGVKLTEEEKLLPEKSDTPDGNDEGQNKFKNVEKEGSEEKILIEPGKQSYTLRNVEEANKSLPEIKAGEERKSRDELNNLTLKDKKTESASKSLSIPKVSDKKKALPGTITAQLSENNGQISAGSENKKSNEGENNGGEENMLKPEIKLNEEGKLPEEAPKQLSKEDAKHSEILCMSKLNEDQKISPDASNVHVNEGNSNGSGGLQIPSIKNKEEKSSRESNHENLLKDSETLEANRLKSVLTLDNEGKQSEIASKPLLKDSSKEETNKSRNIEGSNKEGKFSPEERSLEKGEGNCDGKNISGIKSRADKEEKLFSTDSNKLFNKNILGGATKSQTSQKLSEEEKALQGANIKPMNENDFEKANTSQGILKSGKEELLPQKAERPPVSYGKNANESKSSNAFKVDDKGKSLEEPDNQLTLEKNDEEVKANKKIKSVSNQSEEEKSIEEPDNQLTLEKNDEEIKANKKIKSVSNQSEKEKSIEEPDNQLTLENNDEEEKANKKTVIKQTEEGKSLEEPDNQINLENNNEAEKAIKRVSNQSEEGKLLEEPDNKLILENNNEAENAIKRISNQIEEGKLLEEPDNQINLENNNEAENAIKNVPKQTEEGKSLEEPDNQINLENNNEAEKAIKSVSNQSEEEKSIEEPDNQLTHEKNDEADKTIKNVPKHTEEGKSVEEPDNELTLENKNEAKKAIKSVPKHIEEGKSFKEPDNQINLENNNEAENAIKSFPSQSEEEKLRTDASNRLNKESNEKVSRSIYNMSDEEKSMAETTTKQTSNNENTKEEENKKRNTKNLDEAKRLLQYPSKTVLNEDDIPKEKVAQATAKPNTKEKMLLSDNNELLNKKVAQSKNKSQVEKRLSGGTILFVERSKQKANEPDSEGEEASLSARSLNEEGKSIGKKAIKFIFQKTLANKSRSAPNLHETECLKKVTEKKPQNELDKKGESMQYSNLMSNNDEKECSISGLKNKKEQKKDEGKFFCDKPVNFDREAESKMQIEEKIKERVKEEKKASPVVNEQSINEEKLPQETDQQLASEENGEGANNLKENIKINIAPNSPSEEFKSVNTESNANESKKQKTTLDKPLPEVPVPSQNDNDAKKFIKENLSKLTEEEKQSIAASNPHLPEKIVKTGSKTEGELFKKSAENPSRITADNSIPSKMDHSSHLNANSASISPAISRDNHEMEKSKTEKEKAADQQNLAAINPSNITSYRTEEGKVQVLESSIRSGFSKESPADSQSISNKQSFTASEGKKADDEKKESKIYRSGENPMNDKLNQTPSSHQEKEKDIRENTDLQGSNVALIPHTSESNDKIYREISAGDNKSNAEGKEEKKDVLTNIKNIPQEKSQTIISTPQPFIPSINETHTQPTNSPKQSSPITPKFIVQPFPSAGSSDTSTIKAKEIKLEKLPSSDKKLVTDEHSDNLHLISKQCQREGTEENGKNESNRNQENQYDDKNDNTDSEKSRDFSNTEFPIEIIDCTAEGKQEKVQEEKKSEGLNAETEKKLNQEEHKISEKESKALKQDIKLGLPVSDNHNKDPKHSNNYLEEHDLPESHHVTNTISEKPIPAETHKEEQTQLMPRNSSTHNEEIKKSEENNVNINPSLDANSDQNYPVVVSSSLRGEDSSNFKPSIRSGQAIPDTIFSFATSLSPSLNNEPTNQASIALKESTGKSQLQPQKEQTPNKISTNNPPSNFSTPGTHDLDSMMIHMQNLPIEKSSLHRRESNKKAAGKGEDIGDNEEEYENEDSHDVRRTTKERVARLKEDEEAPLIGGSNRFYLHIEEEKLIYANRMGADNGITENIGHYPTSNRNTAGIISGDNNANKESSDIMANPEEVSGDNLPNPIKSRQSEKYANEKVPVIPLTARETVQKMIPEKEKSRGEYQSEIQSETNIHKKYSSSSAIGTNSPRDIRHHRVASPQMDLSLSELETINIVLKPQQTSHSKATTQQSPSKTKSPEKLLTEGGFQTEEEEKKKPTTKKGAQKKTDDNGAKSTSLQKNYQKYLTKAGDAANTKSSTKATTTMNLDSSLQSALAMISAVPGAGTNMSPSKLPSITKKEGDNKKKQREEGPYRASTPEDKFKIPISLGSKLLQSEDKKKLEKSKFGGSRTAQRSPERDQPDSGFSSPSSTRRAMIKMRSKFPIKLEQNIPPIFDTVANKGMSLIFCD